MTPPTTLAALVAALDAIDPEPLDPTLARLVLAIEDRRFWRHQGVDPGALLRAGVRFVCGRAKGGASTIDMQLVRTLTNRREHSLSRKAHEIALAIGLRRRIGPERIIASYATIAYCGEGVKGLTQASHRLYGCEPSNATLSQKAIVAAALRYPIPAVSTNRWSTLIRRRARYALAMIDRVSHRLERS